MMDVNLTDPKTPLEIEQAIVSMLRDDMLRSFFDRHFLVGVLLDAIDGATQDQVNHALSDLERRDRIKSQVNERGDVEVCLATDEK